MLSQLLGGVRPDEAGGELGLLASPLNTWHFHTMQTLSAQLLALCPGFQPSFLPLLPPRSGRCPGVSSGLHWKVVRTCSTQEGRVSFRTPGAPPPLDRDIGKRMEQGGTPCLLLSTGSLTSAQGSDLKLNPLLGSLPQGKGQTERPYPGWRKDQRGPWAHRRPQNPAWE